MVNLHTFIRIVLSFAVTKVGWYKFFAIISQSKFRFPNSFTLCPKVAHSSVFRSGRRTDVDEVADDDGRGRVFVVADGVAAAAVVAAEAAVEGEVEYVVHWSRIRGAA